MRVSQAMSAGVLSIGPSHTLRQAAMLMATRRIGAAVVMDPDNSGIGILTERDILHALAAGKDPDVEVAADHLTSELVYAVPEWTLEDAAHAMVRGGFRHLVVLSNNEVVGIISVRDIVRVWSEQATSLSSATTTAGLTE